MIATVALLLLLASPEPIPLLDQEPPAAALQGTSSPRLARSVSVRFDASFSDEPTPLTPDSGAKSNASTMQPKVSLARYTLATARRHFEDATWAKEGEAGKGREVVIKRVVVQVRQGPVYTVQVMLDRVEDGRRLGTATGTGVAVPDRTNDRMAAAFIPGPFGFVAGQDASSPKAKKDAAHIELATLRAVDNALLQLAAYWSGEQLTQEYQQKALEQQAKAAKDAAAEKKGKK